jgi:hypothetical protein
MLMAATMATLPRLSLSSRRATVDTDLFMRIILTETTLLNGRILKER